MMEVLESWTHHRAGIFSIKSKNSSLENQEEIIDFTEDMLLSILWKTVGRLVMTYLYMHYHLLLRFVKSEDTVNKSLESF